MTDTITKARASDIFLTVLHNQRHIEHVWLPRAVYSGGDDYLRLIVPTETPVDVRMTRKSETQTVESILLQCVPTRNGWDVVCEGITVLRRYR